MTDCVSILTHDTCIEGIRYYGGWDVVFLILISIIFGLTLGYIIWGKAYAYSKGEQK